MCVCAWEREREGERETERQTDRQRVREREQTHEYIERKGGRGVMILTHCIPIVRYRPLTH